MLSSHWALNYPMERLQVRMGFPSRAPEGTRAFVGPDAKLGNAAFACPRCKALVDELPCGSATSACLGALWLPLVVSGTIQIHWLSMYANVIFGNMEKETNKEECSACLAQSCAR